MATPAPEFTPELNEAVLESIRARIEQTRLQQMSEAKGAATARGLAGSSYQAVREGMANRSASMSLADAYANIAMEKAKMQREERLIKEGQTFQSGESLAERKFTAEQGLLGREFQANESRLGREFQSTQADIERTNANANARKDRRAAIISAGLGALGSGLGVAFCFPPNTPVEMADGSRKSIKDLVLGDETKGGKVISVRFANGPDEIYSYKGVLVTGNHAVLEDGKWLRVKDSRLSECKAHDKGLVCSIATVSHRIYVGGVEFADEFETDYGTQISDADSLDLLNKLEQVRTSNAPK
jgi:hypothetical protein